MRDNFTSDAKRTLEQRAGHRCSFPGCDAETSGPSQEGPQIVSKTGMACHIVAASGGPGARRVDPKVTSEERSSYENGIWMCHNHGTLIDRDEVRFTAPLLRQWRKTAERRAAIRQAKHQVTPHEFNLFEHEIIITIKDDLNETLIAHAFIDAGIPIFWGREISAAARDFVFEITQNALTHGGAHYSKIIFTPKSIVLVDDGMAFDPRTLVSIRESRGGRMAFEALKRSFGDQVNMSITSSDNGNKYKIQYIRTRSDITSQSPCAVSFREDISASGDLSPESLERLQGCSTLYILLPDFMSFSKSTNLRRKLPLTVASREVVFVGYDISQGVQELLSEVSGSRFLPLPEGDDTDFYPA